MKNAEEQISFLYSPLVNVRKSNLFLKKTKTTNQQASWSMHIYAAKSRCTFQNSTRNPSFLEETRPHQSFKKPYKKKKERKKERKKKKRVTVLKTSTSCFRYKTRSSRKSIYNLLNDFIHTYVHIHTACLPSNYKK